VGINEFALYQDGIIVTTRANTALLDDFLDDLLAWSQSALGIVQTDIPPHERHYESNVIVGLDIHEEKSLAFLGRTNKSLQEYQESYGLRPFEFAFGALQVANDTTTYGGKKPIPFTVVRRVNVPFEANVYFSTAPLKTDDHLAVLEALEKDLR
jgi:hypothetical protein